MSFNGSMKAGAEFGFLMNECDVWTRKIGKEMVNAFAVLKRKRVLGRAWRSSLLRAWRGEHAVFGIFHTWRTCIVFADEWDLGTPNRSMMGGRYDIPVLALVLRGDTLLKTLGVILKMWRN